RMFRLNPEPLGLPLTRSDRQLAPLFWQPAETLAGIDGPDLDRHVTCWQASPVEAPARLSSLAALSASIAANLYNSPNVGVLKQASAKISDVEPLSIATRPIWTSSVACSPSAWTPSSLMSPRLKMSFKKPCVSPIILPRG